MSRDISKILKNQRKRRLLKENEADPKLNFVLTFLLKEEVSDYLNEVKQDLENKLKVLKEQIDLVKKFKEPENGYTPIKGKDYFDGKDVDEIKIIKNILSKIKIPKDGKDVDEKVIVKKLLTKIPKPKDGNDGKNGEDGKDGNDGSPDTPEQITDKVNTLEEKIEIKVIKGLKNYLDNIVKKIQDVKSSQSSKSGGGGSSNTIHESHSVDSSTTSITLQYNVANNGNKIFLAYSGGVIEKDVHYTVSGKTITILETLRDNTYLYVIYDRI